MGERVEASAILVVILLNAGIGFLIEWKAERTVSALRSHGAAVAPVVREQVEAALYTQAISRLVGAIERRVDEVLEVNQDALGVESWTVVSETLLEAAESALQKRRERYTGEGGQISKDLDAMLNYLNGMKPDMDATVELAATLKFPEFERDITGLAMIERMAEVMFGGEA